MRRILNSRKHHYLKKVGTFLVAVALIVVMVGCGGTTTLRYGLTMAVAPGGSGTATDLTGGSPYAGGTGVSIKAIAAAGYQFVRWTAPAGTFANENEAETTFTMPAQDVTVTANFFQGHLIRNWHDLHAIRDNPGDTYLLMNALNSATAGYMERASPTANGGKGWQPIGGLDVDLEPVGPFTGTFDSQGYEIRGLFTNRPDEHGVGLFGAVVGGVIENVEMVDADVTGGYHVGGLAGWNEGTVSNSYATGSVDGYYYVGGLMGLNKATISDCYATGEVTGNHSVGGLVGYVWSDVANLDNCYSTGSVDGYEIVGGLVGENYEGTVSNSYATGSVDGYEMVGGLIGLNKATISGCYATGSVTGSYDVGGLVGAQYEGDVSNSHADGDVTGNHSVGGLVGYVVSDFTNLDNCYSTGSVDGYEMVGGLVGWNEGEVSNSHADGNVTGSYDNVGGLVAVNWGTISNSYATGSVTGGDHRNVVGGLVGYNPGTVYSSYATGSVDGGYYVGGLVGYNKGTVSSSFWDVQTSGQATSDGGTGKTTAEMKSIATFSGAGWSIIAVANPGTRNPANIWNIVNGVTYPFLSSQPV